MSEVTLGAGSQASAIAGIGDAGASGTGNPGGAFGAFSAGGADGDLGIGRSGVTPLRDYGLLKVHGADAAAFLQGQLTNDVASLADDDVRLAGYCSVKGRLMASFWVWRDTPAQAYWMACSRDIAAATARRLSMFVLRAKVKVEDVSERVALLGVLRTAGANAAEGAVPMAKSSGREVSLPAVRVPASLAVLLNPAAIEIAADVTVERAVQPVPAEDLEQRLQELDASGIPLLSPQAWNRLEVLSGIARIDGGNRELFVPQMVNFELVGGVNFKKGCYPGQEIVARSQYLGKLKRRMFLGLGAGSLPVSGADVEAAGAASAEPIGQVVMAAALGSGERFVVLFESLTAPLETSVATATEALQPVVQIGRSPISLLPLPYAVPAGAAAPRRGVPGSAAASGLGSASGSRSAPDGPSTVAAAPAAGPGPSSSDAGA